MYDFQIADKLFKGTRQNVGLQAINQHRFKKLAYRQLLDKCSQLLTNGKKHFQSMFTFKDGKLITNLEEIPGDCMLVLVSEVELPVVPFLDANESPDKLSCPDERPIDTERSTDMLQITQEGISLENQSS